MSDFLTEKSIIVFVVYAFVAWINGHQIGHIQYLKIGQATLDPWLVTPMVLGIWIGMLFLIWYGYQTHWYYAVFLVCFSYLVRPFLVTIERRIGLTKQASMISMSGIVIVPIAVAGLVYLILS